MNEARLSLKGILKTLGPGLLFAGAAIGVSHLVQSTRAGASFGFGLVWAVVLAHIVKYPFFEFGSRYVAGTGNNLLKGYREVGNWAFYLVLLVSFFSMFTIQAAVTIVTSGLTSLLFGANWPLVVWSAILLFICIVILVCGHYLLLDRFIKVVIIVLTISTFISFCIALKHGMSAAPDFQAPELWNLAGFSFLIALMGWMPAPLDISIWSSIWAEEKTKATGHRPNIKESLFDFNLGYFTCIITALLFLSLGAFVMYGTGEKFSPSGAVFAKQVVSLYTKNLGEWSYPIILAAALTTMFSTTITCLDAFPRVFKEAIFIMKPELKSKENKLYLFWIILVALGALLLIGCFMHSMKALVDLATILSFISAPVFAYVNYKTITDSHFPTEYKISKPMHILSWFGIGFLSVFSVLFLVWRFFLKG